MILACNMGRVSQGPMDTNVTALPGSRVRTVRLIQDHRANRILVSMVPLVQKTPKETTNARVLLAILGRSVKRN